MNEDIVVAHDHYYTWGGGEAVATELADAFDTHIWTAFAEDDPLQYVPDHITVHELIDGHPLESVFRRISDSGWKRTLFYMFLWEIAPPLRDADVIIQSGNNPNWYVPEDDQVIVKYTHSPPRQAYDLFAESARPLQKHPLRGPLHAVGTLFNRGMKKATRQLWQETTAYPDVWVANSDLVARRIHKYLGIPESKITVVYPPVNVSDYEPTPNPDDYYVVLSRLTTHKRIDVVIDAFHELNRRNGEYNLKVVGTGPKKDALEARAGNVGYIDFEGFVGEPEKRALLANAKASIFAADNEDFGIVPVESMAAGCPVLGVADGFTKHQVRDGDTGLVWERSVENLCQAVRRFEADGVAWDRERIHRYALQFGRDRFHREMHAVVDQAINAHRIDAQLSVPEVADHATTD